MSTEAGTASVPDRTPSGSGPPATLPMMSEVRIGVIGMGYVGLPLAMAFAARWPTVGFDINEARVAALRAGHDATAEVEDAVLATVQGLTFETDPAAIADCNVFIVAVPTPVDRHRQPDLRPLLAASLTVGSVIKPGSVVIYESTVYPGATEEDCLPVVEAASGLELNHDFFAGYSPERINPGDKERPLTRIVKVTSGSTPEAADFVDALYGAIIEAGTFKAAGIRVAEAAKVIENTQRDVGIALINELSMVFSHMGIDTTEVLDAASTKWNFNRLSPGLVGGHCIGVDPYYLVHRSMAAGYIPDIIRRSREINDGMARHAAGLLVRAMIARGQRVLGSRILILGLTFKEDCPDLRNTKVVDLVRALEAYGARVDVHDPRADPGESARATGIAPLPTMPEPGAGYDAVILAVTHAAYREAGVETIRAMGGPGAVFFDMRSAFPRSESDLRL
jgi:UDP-N-acetyl-D-galactosamine dehydrogenase